MSRGHCEGEDIPKVEKCVDFIEDKMLLGIRFDPEFLFLVDEFLNVKAPPSRKICFIFFVHTSHVVPSPSKPKNCKRQH